MWATSPRWASSGYHAKCHEGCYQKHTNPLNGGTISSDISGYHATFTKGTALSENDRGTAWHIMCELALKFTL
jgi:hypothetical protein